MDFFLHYIWRIKKKYYLCKELKKRDMDDTREELVMDYSPILGVTYGLKNVLVEDDSTEKEEEKKEE